MKLTHIILQISEYNKTCEIVCSVKNGIIHIDVDKKAHAQWYVEYWTKERLDELSRMINKPVKLNKF